jgi:RNA polymerase sigma factor (sigma-70 family)
MGAVKAGESGSIPCVEAVELVAVDAGQAGEPMAALADLYQSQHTAMVKLARLITGSQALAEEIVHDAFLAVHRRSTRPEGTIERPAAYLRRAVINGCRSTHRRAGNERRKLDLVSRRATADANLALPVELDEMWLALRVLSTRQRTALVLRYYADLTVPEVAEAMAVPVGTAKSLLSRGLKRLRAEVHQ